MRTRSEGIVTAVEDLSGRFPVRQAALATALAGAAVSFVSCRRWRTAPDWSIPPRRVDDDFLFIPVQGRLVVNGEALAPGMAAVVPHGTEHAVAYAPGVRTCTVLAVHARLRTAWGTPWLQPGGRVVAPLPEAERWHAELTRLAGWEQDQPALARACGGELVRRLLLELVVTGHPLRPPASDLDPRLAAIVAAVQADPGGAPPIAELARRAGLGPLRLRQLWHAGLGCPPKAWVDRLRLAQAATLLSQGTPVGETARRCGFGSVRQLQVRFKAAYGRPPGAWAGIAPAI